LLQVRLTSIVAVLSLVLPIGSIVEWFSSVPPVSAVKRPTSRSVSPFASVVSRNVDVNSSSPLTDESETVVR